MKFLHIQIILFAELDRRSIKGPPTSRSYKKEAVASVYGGLQEEKAANQEEIIILCFSPESGFVREFTVLKVVHLMLEKWDKQRVKLAVRMLSLLTQETSSGFIKVEEGEAEHIISPVQVHISFLIFVEPDLGIWTEIILSLSFLSVS